MMEAFIKRYIVERTNEAEIRPEGSQKVSSKRSQKPDQFSQRITEGSRLPITRAPSADQNVTYNIPREKREEWPPCLSHKLKQSNGAKDWWIVNKTFKTGNDKNCQLQLGLNEANYIHLNVEIGSKSSRIVV